MAGEGQTDQATKPANDNLPKLTMGGTASKTADRSAIIARETENLRREGEAVALVGDAHEVAAAQMKIEDSVRQALRQKHQGDAAWTEERINKESQLNDTERKLIETQVLANAVLARKIAIVEGVDKPLREYLQTLEAINAAEKEGSLTPRQADIQRQELAPAQEARDLDKSLGTSNPYGAEADRSAQAQKDEVVLEAKKRQEQIDRLQKQGIYSAQRASNERVAVERDAQKRMEQIDRASTNARLQFASDFFGNLASLSESKYAAISAIGKAAAITQAGIQTYLAATEAYAAMASIPYVGPVLGAIAAAAAVAAGVANIAKIAGFAEGVVGVRGPGTSTSDSFLARLSDGESVATAEATRKNSTTLAAMNAGASFDAMLSSSAPANSNEPSTTSTTKASSSDSDGIIRAIGKLRSGSSTVDSKSVQAMSRATGQAVSNAIRRSSGSVLSRSALVQR
jgi:hypothetical protein